MGPKRRPFTHAPSARHQARSHGSGTGLRRRGRHHAKGDPANADGTKWQVTKVHGFEDQDAKETLAVHHIERGYPFTTVAEREIVRGDKGKTCHSTLGFDTEKKAAAQSSNKVTCAHSDGNNITVDSERFRCTEVLYQPQPCDIDIRKDRYTNVVLSGDTTKFPGIGERMTKEKTCELYATVVLTGGTIASPGRGERMTMEHTCEIPEGLDPTEDLMKSLTEHGHSFTTVAEYEIVRSDTGKIGYSVLSYDTEMKAATEHSDK